MKLIQLNEDKKIAFFGDCTVAVENTRLTVTKGAAISDLRSIDAEVHIQHENFLFVVDGESNENLILIFPSAEDCSAVVTNLNKGKHPEPSASCASYKDVIFKQLFYLPLLKEIQAGIDGFEEIRILLVGLLLTFNAERRLRFSDMMFKSMVASPYQSKTANQSSVIKESVINYAALAEPSSFPSSDAAPSNDSIRQSWPSAEHQRPEVSRAESEHSNGASPMIQNAATNDKGSTSASIFGNACRLFPSQYSTSLPSSRMSSAPQQSSLFSAFSPLIFSSLPLSNATSSATLAPKRLQQFPDSESEASAKRQKRCETSESSIADVKHVIKIEPNSSPSYPLSVASTTESHNQQQPINSVLQRVAPDKTLFPNLNDVEYEFKEFMVNDYVTVCWLIFTSKERTNVFEYRKSFTCFDDESSKYYYCSTCHHGKNNYDLKVSYAEDGSPMFKSTHEHYYKPQKYRPKNYMDKNNSTVINHAFKVFSKEFNGVMREWIAVFYDYEKSLGYEYYFDPFMNHYRCVSCRNRKVIAEIINDGKQVKLGWKKHKCQPKKLEF